MMMIDGEGEEENFVMRFTVFVVMAKPTGRDAGSASPASEGRTWAGQ